MASTNGPAAPAAGPGPAPAPMAPAPAPALTNGIAPAGAFAAPRDRARERTITLENEFVRVEFTSWGGGIRQVELLQHRAHGSDDRVFLNGADFPPMLSLPGLPGAGPEADYDLEQEDRYTVVARTGAGAGVGVSKRFTLGPDYSIASSFTVNRGGSPATNGLDTVVGTAVPAHAKEPPDLLAAGWLKVEGEKYGSGQLKTALKKGPQRVPDPPEPIAWGAVKSQFFAMVLTPATNAAAMEYRKADMSPPPGWQGKQPPQGLTGTLTLLPVAAGEYRAEEYAFSLYAGPKQYSRLLALRAGQEAVMQFGMFGFISVVLLKGMVFLHGLIPNYGVAIIIITLIIKIVLWPVQAKSMKSMKAMQKFQPLMTKLREKHKDQPQKLNAEMMKLYKEHKINPFGGCLPMLVQIPVFFGFYTMLRSAVELRGAGFLWISDLSQPDTITQLAGFPLNPLPLLMGVSMLWQMKLTPTGGDPKQQQMMLIMPVVFLFICYNMSSGLVLYWTVQQFLSIGQQWWSLRRPEAGPVAAGPAPAGKAK
ncbi:membrane protein insertase YidC, partial [bacterium]|nr:membrane protein insertase YidC [bacterium]